MTRLLRKQAFKTFHCFLKLPVEFHVETWTEAFVLILEELSMFHAHRQNGQCETSTAECVPLEFKLDPEGWRTHTHYSAKGQQQPLFAVCRLSRSIAIAQLQKLYIRLTVKYKVVWSETWYKSRNSEDSAIRTIA